MGDVTSIFKIIEVNAVSGKELIAHTDGNETVDNGDTLAIDLSKYGITKFLGVVGFIHTTKGSVVVQEQPTTAVVGSVLTLTVGGATPNKERVYKIFGI